jgi:hypothetical protein
MRRFGALIEPVQKAIVYHHTNESNTVQYKIDECENSMIAEKRERAVRMAEHRDEPNQQAKNASKQDHSLTPFRIRNQSNRTTFKTFLSYLSH